jgi:hypothetical protein
MLRSLTIEQFIELRAAEILEPFRAQRADMHAQMVLAGLSNVLLAVHQSKTRFGWHEFVLPFRNAATKVKPVEKTKEQLFQLARWCVGLFNNVRPE